MKSFFLALAAVMTLGLGMAQAATPSLQNSQIQQTHRPNYYNWLEGGGG